MKPNRLMLAFAAALVLAACGGSDAGPGGTARTLGKADAPVKLVEYASMSCAHCAQFNNEDFPTLKAKYIDTGKVHYELREILTPPYEIASAGFLLAACAGPEKYFDVIDAVFHNIMTPEFGGNPRAGLINIARGAGMSDAEFETCITDEAALKALNSRVEKNAPKLHRGTPTFWIDGVKYTGNPTAADLSKVIDEALAKK